MPPPWIEHALRRRFEAFRAPAAAVLGRLTRALHRAPATRRARLTAALRRAHGWRMREGALPRRVRWAIALVLGGCLAGLWWTAPPECAAEGCPSWSNLAGYRLSEAPHVHDASGALFAHLPGDVRIWTPLDEMPEELVEGVIAVEDRRFRAHGGIDLRGILRAAVADLRAGTIEEGASTITMQLARNLWWPTLASYGPWRRKVTEMRIARRLERFLGKDRILELYLNRIYLGDGVYGVGAAARHYFDVDPAELDLARIATLIGAIKTPERYDPRVNPAQAARRRDVVLDVFAEVGVVSPERIRAARADSVRTVPAPPLEQGRSYYAAAVLRELRALLPDPTDRSGVHVYTEYDPEAQASAERRLSEQIARIEAGRYGRYRHEVPPDSGRIERAAGDSPYLQGAAVVMDASTGAIRALVGGRSFAHSEFDRVFLALRQPGSAFKPIVYAAALEKGAVTLGDAIDTRPVQVAASDGTWTPEDAQADGERMRVRAALAASSNWAAVRVGMATGTGTVARLARRLGISSPIDRVPASYLGSSSLRPVELVAAYAPFGNGGRRVTPHLITRIEDRDGRILYELREPAHDALDPRVAYLTRLALEDVVNGGTGSRARSAGYWGPAAGKTGTTNAWRDAWFVGLNGEVALGVWLGFDRPRTIVTGGYGGTLAAPVWGAIMADLYGRGSGAPGFPPRPPGLRAVVIDGETGFRAAAGCPVVDPQVELYLPDTIPPSECELFGDVPDQGGARGSRHR